MSDPASLSSDESPSDVADVIPTENVPAKFPIFRSAMMLGLGFAAFTMVAVNVWAMAAPESFGAIVPDAVAPKVSNEAHNRGCSCEHKDAFGEMTRGASASCDLEEVDT